MNKLLLALALILAPSLASAQCSGVFTNGTVCGNATGANAPPRMTTITSFPGLFANPTAQVGLTTVNGSATTAMRSDAAPALDQGIVPTWTGQHTFSLLPIFPTTTAHYGLYGPTSGSPATPAFRQGTTDDINYTATGAGATARTQTSKNGDIVSVLDYGAAPGNTAAQNVTAFQAAVDSATSGATILIPGSGYNINAPITFTKPVTVKCTSNFLDTSNGNINFTSTTANMFVVNTSNWTIDGCYLNAAGTPTTSQAIVIGTDGVSVADAAITAATTTLTSATASWTSANIGNDVNVVGAGAAGVPLFAQITAVTDAHTVTLSTAASTTVSGASAKYGTTYLYNRVLNTQIVNFGKGFHIIEASAWVFSNSYTLDNIGIHIENQLNPDHGSGRITSSYVTAIGTTAGHYPILWNSGGEIYVTATKILNGQYGIYINSTVGLTGVFSVANSGIENCGTNAIRVSNDVQFNDVIVTGSEISCGAPNIFFDNAASSIVSTANITGNVFQGGGGTAVDAGQVNYLTINGNTINTGGGNPAVNIRSSCNNCSVTHNNIVGATLTYANASTTTTIDDPIGMTFGNLPTAAANGSRIFVTDGLNGSSPCSASSTGATAFRNNGTWVCGSPTSPGGSNTQVQFNSSSSFGGSPNLTWASPALTIGVAGSSTGQLKLTGSTSGTITFQGQAAAGTYNWNYPTTAGSSGNILASGGGTTNPMTWLTTTGSGTVVVLAASPSLTTPTLGVATATSINKMAITAPATSSTLAVADGKTFTASKTITLTGTDSTTLTGPTVSAPIGDIANVQVFTASGTYTPTSGTRYAVARLVGGGGGGGGATTGSGAVGGGGGEGEIALYFWSGPTSQTITVGTGGTAGASSGGTGGTGGTTSIGAIVTAVGGSGGVGASAVGPNAGGIGGTGGTGATIAVPGASGGAATSNGSTAIIIGKGGGQGGAAAPAPVAPAAGNAGTRGGGGSGAICTAGTPEAGGAGGAGYVIITEYY